MTVVEIIRIETSNEGTIGVLRINKKMFCVTLEPAAGDNAPGSSIPAGQYVCEKYHSKRFGWTYRVCNVPGRDGIAFHPLNTATETLGCIGVAQHVGKLRGDRAILNSGATFREFVGVMCGAQTFHLTITEKY